MRPIVTCGVMLGPGWRFAVGPSHRAVSNRPGRPAGPATIAARERARAPRTEVTNRTPVLARPTGFERADAISIRIPVDGAENAGEATA